MVVIYINYQPVNVINDVVDSTLFLSFSSTSLSTSLSYLSSLSFTKIVVVIVIVVITNTVVNDITLVVTISVLSSRLTIVNRCLCRHHDRHHDRHHRLQGDRLRRHYQRQCRSCRRRGRLHFITVTLVIGIVNALIRGDAARLVHRALAHPLFRAGYPQLTHCHVYPTLHRLQQTVIVPLLKLSVPFPTQNSLLRTWALQTVREKVHFYKIICL